MPSETFKKFKARLTVRGVPHSAEASASLPASTPASRNSQASFLAAGQVSKGLDFILQDPDFEVAEDYWDFTKKRFQELQKAAGEYSNSAMDLSKAKVWSW
uniref:Uncharacterized protein n=1 Tax=Gibberella zeae TaxID=5518 RepID=A0A4E9E9R7_GIBZA